MRLALTEGQIFYLSDEVVEGDSNQNRTSGSLRRKTSAQSIVSEGKDVYYSGGVKK
jgi:hypothetical protein